MAIANEKASFFASVVFPLPLAIRHEDEGDVAVGIPYATGYVLSPHPVSLPGISDAAPKLLNAVLRYQQGF